MFPGTVLGLSLKCVCLCLCVCARVCVYMCVFVCVHKKVGDALQELTEGILSLLSPSPPPNTNTNTAPSPSLESGLSGRGGVSAPAAVGAPAAPAPEGSNGPPIAAVVVPCVVGSLLLAAMLAVWWSVRLKRDIIRHVSGDTQVRSAL